MGGRQNPKRRNNKGKRRNNEPNKPGPTTPQPAPASPEPIGTPEPIPTPQTAPLATKPTKKKPARAKHPAVLYLRSLGGLTIIGLAAIVTPSSHFYWWGIGILYTGVLALVVDVLFEKWRVRNKIIVSLLWLIGIALVSHYAIFVRAPLEVGVSSSRGDYDIGTNISGIIWEPGMSALHILLSNHSSFSYDGLDLTLTPDVSTRSVSQVSTVPDVSVSVLRRAGDLEFGDMTITGYDKDGHKVKDMPVLIYSSGAGFRLHCPVLPSDTTIEIIAALVNPKYRPKSNNPALVELNGGDPSMFAGPKRVAKSVFVRGIYSVLNHPHHVEYTYAVK